MYKLSEFHFIKTGKHEKTHTLLSRFVYEINLHYTIQSAKICLVIYI